MSDPADAAVRDVLVVDNDPAVLTFMRMFLETKDYTIQTAEDGLDALTLLEDHVPEVVFIDLIMPNIGGEKLCQILRTQRRFDDTYLIVLSAISSEREIDYVSLGFDACIAKGPLKELGQHILDVLGKLGSEITRGNPGAIYGLDTLYRREITRELLSTKRHYELIIENMSESIVETTTARRIVFANPSAVALLAVQEEELLAGDFAELFEGDMRDRIREAAERAERGSVLIGDEEPILFGERILTLQIHPVSDDGQISLIIIINDITEPRRSETALREAHTELEARVAERTSELARVNESLRREVEQRKLLGERLQASLAEKVTMLNEIHHRVKNNLQIISSLLGIYGRKLQSEELGDAVREIRNRIQSISLVHEKLYRSRDLSAVDIADYVRSFVGYLVRSFALTPGRIRTRVDAQRVLLNIDIAVPCALVINELVTNSLKYAFPSGRDGSITIRVDMPDSNVCRIVMEDDGVGMEDSLNIESPDTLGLRIVKVLVRQLSGTLRLKRQPGTRYTIEFPIETARGRPATDGGEL